MTRVDEEAAWFVFRETLRQLEEDAAGFISMDGLRTRVREFESRWQVSGVWRVLQQVREETNAQRRIASAGRRRVRGVR